MTPILIVDDELGVRESLKIVLSKDYSVYEADGMEAAVAKVIETRPAVVLLDILLPKTDGLEVLRRIKAIHPGCEVIMLTALNSRHVAEQAAKSGAFDLVGKPFDIAVLRAKVRGALEKIDRRSPSAGLMFPSRTVKVGERFGQLWVINEGLQVGEKVVAEGTQKVREDMVVSPKPFVGGAQAEPGAVRKPGAKPEAKPQSKPEEVNPVRKSSTF